MIIAENEVMKLKKYLRDNRITSKSIADKMGLSLPLISSYFNGRVSIPVKHHLSLSKLLPLDKNKIKKGIFVLRKIK